MNSTENEEMSRALRELADRQPGGPAPVTELLHRGRRRKRLRAVAVTGSAAAVVAVALAGAAVLVPHASNNTQAGPASSASVTASATASAASSPSPTRTVPATSAGVAEALKSWVPSGYRITDTWLEPGMPSLPPNLPPIARIGALHTVTDGGRTGNIRIEITRSMSRSNPSAHPQPTCGTVPNCSVSTRPDGSVLLVELPPAAAGGEQIWQATLYAAGGTMITASSGNVSTTGVDRALPLLDGEHLTALALDPVWRQVADSLTLKAG